MSAAFPKGRTAFLVIHGIGEQNPFETLDSFGRGLICYLKSVGIDFQLEHRLADRKKGTEQEWTESYVRIRFSPDSYIDLHEYYWAYLTEKKITMSEIWQWVNQTLQGTKRFFRENVDLQKRYEARQKPYWFRLRQVFWMLLLLYPWVYLALLLTPLWKSLQGFRQWLEKLGPSIIVDYIGDIAIYTTMDQKSSHYATRQKILTESSKLLEEILTAEDYQQVYLAGHSLGSVIAFDTLNRLNLKSISDANTAKNTSKLSGLITFGSPLDKIAFFFREHARPSQYLRRQIMGFLHSFKARPLSLKPEPFAMTSQVERKLDHLPWVNYYADNDPISGHLDFYLGVENCKLQLPQGWGKAHACYWDYLPFYRNLVQKFTLI